MTSDIIFVLVTIGVTFVLMLTEVIPLAATMALSGLALLLGGIIEPGKLYSGFGGTTIIFLVAMSIIVDSLTETGIVSDMSRLFFKGKMLKSPRRAIFIMSMFAGIATGFISNTALVVLMIPVLVSLAKKSKGNVQVKYILIAVATEATVGGSISLIGGAPNLATQGALIEAGVETMEFFSAAPLSIILVTITAIYFSTIGYKIMHKTLNFEDQLGYSNKDEELVEEKKVTWKKVVSGLVLITCIVLFIAGVYDNQVIAIAGVTILWIVKCIKPVPSLKSVDWNTMVVLNFALVLAGAVNSSGTGKFVADKIILLSGGANATYSSVLLWVILIGAVLTQVMSNTATSSMFTPICVSLAATLGVSPLSLAIPMLCMVNCAVTSPLGSPCMTVSLAGGYRAKDYMILGLPLLLILIPVTYIASHLLY